MPINFTGSTRNFSELEQITEELYQDSKTLRERVIDIEEGHKSGTDVYESKVTESREAKMNGGTRLQTRRPITLKPGQEEEYTIVLNSPLKEGKAAGKSFTVSLTGVETFKGESTTGLPLTSATFSL